MKTINELIQKAIELQAGGLSTGQIADELNVSRETATWLLTHTKKKDVTQAPKDIYIDWSNIGRSSSRQRLIASALVDIILDNLEDQEKYIDVVVGVALSGIPLASLVAEELGCEFATYHPNKQRWEPESMEIKGTISQNFAKVEGKECVLIDDVVTTGTTITEAVSVLEELGAKPVAIAVLVDKIGIDEIHGIPLNALLRVTRVDKIE
ncbi:MAG: orotate phosphoribosyltransferase-like protein [Candidatus Methanoperedens sp.]|nr:orotate phosphoribosyltransferase-like protein [Candidatus Methanoperedens sp.]MCZ7360624.1 orotate phosphoribosyltransferase-like protein [Candidatus Methanoperedens sp.]HLB71957.1 orotate phosphoribosyltransferase-like protein [Candidatus Methanoperedens sp.]